MHFGFSQSTKQPPSTPNGSNVLSISNVLRIYPNRLSTPNVLNFSPQCTSDSSSEYWTQVTNGKGPDTVIDENKKNS